MPKNTLVKSSTICAQSIIFGIICASVKLASIIISDSPYEMIHKLDKNGIIPSMWIWHLTGCLMMFISGMAAGTVIKELASGNASAKNEREACIGGLYFITSFFLTVIHYPLFFACERILISFIVSVAAVICSAICAMMWSKISAKACLMMCGNSFFLLYVTFVNLNILVIN